MGLAIENAIAPVRIAQKECFPCQGASIMALSERLFDIRLFMGLGTNALGDAKYDNNPSVRLILCNGPLDGRTACLGLDVRIEFICLFPRLVIGDAMAPFHFAIEVRVL
ncbi:hypothetical protein DPSP01_002882 [Paraphaeosphaeria sporulosa]